MNVHLFCVMYFYCHSGQKQPDNFEEILKANAKLQKYLKEKCYSPTNLLQVFCIFF